MSAATSLMLRGIFGVVFGILAFGWPGLTLTALVFLFGSFALLDGLANIAHATGHRGSQAWVLVLEGLLGVAAGTLTFIWPGVTLLVLITMIAIWAVATGILDVVASIRLRRVITGEWLLALSGILSIGLGVLLFAYPLTGAIVLAWWVGAYAFTAGVVLIVLALRLRHRVAAIA